MKAGPILRAALAPILALLLALTLTSAPALAQVLPAPTPAPQVDETGALVPNAGGRGPIGPGFFQPALNGAAAGLNYDDWSAMAERAETLLSSSSTDSAGLDALRALLVDWREALLGAQSANSTRIAVIRSQIAALGPPPGAGLTEAEEIAGRRSELTDQLVRLQAPGLKADEAYERADGLILQIDTLRRERQAEELLRRWPSPVNPANWPEALTDLSGVVLSLWQETAAKVGDPRVLQAFVNALPLVLLLLVFSGAVLWRGRRWYEEALDRLPLRAETPVMRAAVRAAMRVASLGQIVLPLLACVALTLALRRSGLLGPLGFALAGVIVPMGLAVFTAIWLGRQLFGAASPLRDIAALAPERWAEGRFLVFACGLLIALARLRGVVIGQQDLGAAAASATHFPILLFGGLVLIRIGRLLGNMMAPGSDDEDDSAALRGIGRLIAKAVVAIGIIGPALAMIGYNAAAAALIQPAAVSLGLLGVLALLQQLLFDLWALASRQWAGQGRTLVPVLLSLALGLASLPVFALVWGADIADLTELWARFQGGFTLGETRISPTDFILFAAIFGAGYSATRVLQGVLKGQVLPRIGMDQGGRNAIAVGTGYAGIFLSALIAINATGIDLSGLAIVAGALSVGIGFGLQAIVSNFVSGIILLIERPVSEGDWIEVGTVQGIVKSISVRSTRIQTFDRSDVIVPNQDLITGRVTNWTRYSLSGRIVVPVTAAYSADSQHVARVLAEIAQSFPLALRSPAPQVALMAIGAEVMTFELRVILKDINTMVQARSELNHEILRRFREEGIALTPAHRDHLAKAAEAAAEAGDLARNEADMAAWLAPPAPEAAPAKKPRKRAASGGGARAD